MDPAHDIKKLLENLSHKMGQTEADDILSIIPSKTDDNPEKKLFDFLERSAEMFSNSFCFRPPMCSLVKSYTNGEYLSVVRKVKRSDRAILIYLLRMEPKDSAERLSFTVKYEISIYEFNLVKTIGSISNIRMIAKDDCRLINCREIFVMTYSKKEYTPFIQKTIKFFKKIFGVGEKIQDRIARRLERFEKDILWFIGSNLITMR